MRTGTYVLFKYKVQTSPVCIFILFSTTVSADLYMQCSWICPVCVGICSRAFAQGKCNCYFDFLAIYFTILVVVACRCNLPMELSYIQPCFFVAVYLTGAPNESIT